MFADLLYRVRALFRHHSMEGELDDELRAHLEQQTEKYVRSGLAPEEARRRAHLDFGGLDKAQEECRDACGVSFIESLLQDIRYGLRALARTPAFTVMTAMTLALGIGATTAIFSVVDAVLLHPLPYQRSNQLVEIQGISDKGEENGVSAGDFCEWQGSSRDFQGLAAYKPWEFHALTGIQEPDEVWASPVTANLFPILGVHPALGRSFVSGESQAVLLSFQYWRSHFFSDRNLIGKAVALDGKAYTVVGIAPADFEFPRANTQMWIPLEFDAANKADHEDRSLRVVARLQPGVTSKQAQSEMDALSGRQAVEYPKTNAGWGARVEPFRGREIGAVMREALWALLGAVFFVLMIVCANSASMLLARGTSREREYAIRAALGASRSRLVRQILTESLMLAAAGGVAGLALAALGLRMIEDLVPKYTLIDTQGVHRIEINLPVLAFTLALTLLTGVVVGLLPALRVSRRELGNSLKHAGWNSTAGAGRARLERGLVISEVAIAFVLLVGAGLMIQTFDRLETTPTGFKPDHLLTVRVPLVKYKYSQGASAVNFYRQVAERIRAIPGVESVGMANNLPFTGFHTSVNLPLPANSTEKPDADVYVTARNVSPGYFRAMGIPFVEGRDFTSADVDHEARCVVIVNEAMARRYWPGVDPVGKQLQGACPKDAPTEVVGLVRDSKQNTLDSQALPEIYAPYTGRSFASFLVTFVVRASSDPLRLAPAVRRAVWEVDHDQPVIQIRTMQEVIVESIWGQRFAASMLGVFAAIALLLAALGIYAVLSYSVSQRTREIGIRSALGATRGDVLGLVVGGGFLPAVIGLMIGFAGALTLTRFLSSLLYGVKPTDPATYFLVSLVLAAVALLASYIPARRATKVDPMTALRCE